MKTFKGSIAISAAALLKAAKIIGSERMLAAKIGVSRQNIQYWRAGALLPYNKAVETSMATNGKVGLDDLRPDLKDLNKKLIAFFSKYTD